MKRLFTLLMLLAATCTWAADNQSHFPPAKSGVVKGEVLETKDTESNTYLRLKTADGEIWAAVFKTPVKVGTTVTIENAIVMKDFQSKTLKRTFSTIIFGSLAGAPNVAPPNMGGSPQGMGSSAPGTMAGNASGTGSSTPNMMGGSAPAMGSGPKSMMGVAPKMNPAQAHSGIPKADDVGNVKVPKAKGENAHTVAEIITKSAALKDKPVLVSGKVVKYNPGIMGKNWLHLRDGSGSASKETNDILVTTQGQAKIGDVVTVKGIVHTDKDFGMGYTYKALIEDATLQ